MINAQVKIVKKIPKKQFDEFQDKVIYNVARITLDRSSPTIPWLTGHMYGDLYARGVQGGNKVYTLGVEQTEYAIYVWNMGQNTNWTNKASKPKWFLAEFDTYKEIIIEQAVRRAEKVIG